MEFTSDLTATPVQFMGNDLMVVNAARVSVGGHSDVLDAKDIGLINYLAKSGHTSPFEHNSITFL
ncbi:MAG: FAD-dependent thymidylate synthase, partial [Actinobacteria bacterium]|nr:FAD-dependent thymidylate synthase [Actinomycetota bacterium]